MWCNQCGQDVPGLASAAEGRFRCPRCGRDLAQEESIRPAEQTLKIAEPPAAAEGQPRAANEFASAPPSAYDDWEFDEQLRHIGRVIGGQKGFGRQQTTHQRGVARLDPAHAGLSGRHNPASRQSTSGQTAGGLTEFVLPFLTWTTLLLGIMALVCGGVLLGWSTVSGRQDLWTIGMPITLGGQIALLVGLILQLDRLWHDNRSTVAKIDQFGYQLHDLKTTTTMLGTSQHSPGGAFYSHLADGAGPQLLLSDLKSQLDLLAVKIGQEEH